MDGHQIVLPTWVSLLILTISFFKLVNTTGFICGSDFNSAEVPTRPPRTELGSFLVNQNFNEVLFLGPKRELYIYWQHIDDNDRCGFPFQYQVFCKPNTDDEMFNKTIEKKTYTNFVKLRECSIRFEYKCKIYSMNDKGLSKEYSIVNIPREYDRNPKSLSLTRVDFKEGVVELSWNKPKLSNPVQLNNYTLFWCEVDMNQPYECTGYLNWTNIPISETSFKITVNDKNKNYNFAINVNTKTLVRFEDYSEVIYRNTGMIFVSCIAQSNKMPGKINNIEVNVIAARYVQMFWWIECSDRVYGIQGYRVLYCPIVSTLNSECAEPLIEKKLYPGGLPFAKILNYERITVLAMAKLQPLKTYKFIISILTDNGEGLPSDPVFVTTHREGEVTSTGSSVSVWINP